MLGGGGDADRPLVWQEEIARLTVILRYECSAILIQIDNTAKFLLTIIGSARLAIWRISPAQPSSCYGGTERLNRLLQRLRLFIIGHNFVEVLVNRSLVERLGDERCLFRHVTLLGRYVTGGNDDLDQRPMLRDMPSEGEPVHRTWHIDVREQQRGAFPMLCEMDDRFVTVEALVNSKAGVFENVHRLHRDDRIVFNDDSVWDG